MCHKNADENYNQRIDDGMIGKGARPAVRQGGRVYINAKNSKHYSQRISTGKKRQKWV